MRRPQKGPPPVVGRKKLYHSRITLPLTKQALAAIDAKRGKQPRVEWIRAAVEKELRRKPKGKK